MAGESTTDGRRVTAARNVEAILDAAERLLRRGDPLHVSAVAADAGLSRPTVYAHFHDRHQLVEALLARAAREATVAVQAADPDRGPAPDAMRRVVGAGWEHLARHLEVARAAMTVVAPDALHAGHREVAAVFERLLERGRREGAFRHDLPTAWLVSSCLALTHAAVASVNAGEMAPDRALDALAATVEDVCVGRVASSR